MTNVLTDIKDIMKTEEFKVNCPTPKIDAIFNFLTIKVIARRHKEEIAKYTEKNKKIKNGQTVLAGTRITTKELLLIMAENDSKQNVFEYVTEQYPSIDSEEKILYGALYEIGKMNTFIYILKVCFLKK